MFADNSKEELDENTARLTKCPTIKSVLELTMELYPSWIDSLHTRFSKDYPDLTLNWKKVCEKTGSRPTEIVLVNFLPGPNDNRCKFLLYVTDILTSTGFSVRRTSEFVVCSCGALIPSEHSFPFLKEKPSQWKSHCDGCTTPPREPSPPPTLVNMAMEALQQGLLKFE
jgi:hypothetical protein